MGIDFTRLNAITSPNELKTRVLEEFNAAGDFPLSDVLIQHTNAATHVLKLLADEAKYGCINPRTKRRDTTIRRTYKIKVLCDMWGDPVKPGDVIEWKADIRRRDPMGRKYTTKDMMELRRQNREDEFVEYHAAEVGPDGCIVVEFDDAGKLLITHGVYYGTGGPICSHKEIAGKPKMSPSGAMKHRHNWLYMEVPPGVDPSTLGKPKRRVVLVSDGATTSTAADSVEAPKAKRGRKPKSAPAPVESVEPPAAE